MVAHVVPERSGDWPVRHCARGCSTCSISPARQALAKGLCLARGAEGDEAC